MFKKAHKLHCLTGAHVASVVFSPAGRPYVHGDPSFDNTIDPSFDATIGPLLLMKWHKVRRSVVWWVGGEESEKKEMKEKHEQGLGTTPLNNVFFHDFVHCVIADYVAFSSDALDDSFVSATAIDSEAMQLELCRSNQRSVGLEMLNQYYGTPELSPLGTNDDIVEGAVFQLNSTNDEVDDDDDDPFSRCIEESSTDEVYKEMNKLLKTNMP
ncbi:hypothetical protein RHGRI_017520 [Rhododendron griersonianum]|uniref:MADS-box domain-containing protein n=1 Tax=Rhododendron griersonianum TaxID=479676 RepID=A0AAV6JY33_9ERIC|nr:hypothetical protein RHGRI_017520 [Rhododendron griersonianum]